MIRRPASLQKIEQRMGDLSEESLRYKVLDACRRFKNSWIEFGGVLASVHREKSWREWGYADFETYCSKELGVRQSTAAKLLRSYVFLEKEEPDFLKRSGRTSPETPRYPDLDSVNILRLARSDKRIAPAQYGQIRTKVLEEAVEPGDVRKQLRDFLGDADTRETAPRSVRRALFLKSFAKMLREAAREGATSCFLSPRLIDQIGKLAERVESEV